MSRMLNSSSIFSSSTREDIVESLETFQNVELAAENLSEKMGIKLGKSVSEESEQEILSRLRRSPLSLQKS